MRSTIANPYGSSLVLAWALLASTSVTAFAEDATPIPPFTGDRLYVAGVPNQYETVSKAIGVLEAKTPQTYYVVVVKSSGAPGEGATRQYASRLLDVWRRQAKAKDLRLDPDRAVIVVAALDNRQVTVLPGDLLATKHGMKGETIDREIVRPDFIPLARQGEYPQAIIALLNGVDGFIAAREKASAASGPGTPSSSKRMRPGFTRATQYSTEPLPLPWRTSAGFFDTGTSGNTRIHRRPWRRM